MISLSDVHISLGGREVLKGVDLNVTEKECVAIVGPNGCGKSTLVRIMAGHIRPDGGSVGLPSRITIGFLPQEADVQVTHSLMTELLNAFADVQAALTDMRDLEHRMADADPQANGYSKMLQRYADASALVEHRDGYALEARVHRVAAGLGFRHEDMARPCREFSGGWQMRILLAKILLQEPDVLLLDEPTNHLDLESMMWLEEWIRTCARTVVMVSHERAFMDRLVRRIVCLEHGRADVSRGGYSHYIQQSRAKREALWKAYTEQQREIAQAEAFIRKFRYNAARAAQVQSRIKQLEKLERIEPPFHPTAIHFDFPAPPPSHRDVLKLKDLGHAYGDQPVFSDVNLTITRGEKIGLVGVNGAGKSTLLRIMAGLERPTEGECARGGKVNAVHFAQYDTATLASDQTVLQAMEATAPAGEQARTRDVLGAFLFSGDDVDKPLRALSGGERTRFRLAQILFSPANLLLLDEPTNHLDVTSRATVEEALRKYTGTFVIVSHDRVFMNRVTDRIIEIENGAATVYPGKYNDYLARKERLFAQSAADSESASPAPEASADQAKEARRLEHDQRKARSRRQRSLERKVEAIEAEITQLEDRLAQLDSIMADPAVATDYGKLAPLDEEQKNLQRKLDEALKQWERLNDELEEFRNSA